MARFWKDDLGRRWKCSKPGKILQPARRASHAALRRFVFIRDDFTCRICKLAASEIPVEFDGFATVYAGHKPFHLDHIKPRIASGSNHPTNLQMLCETCNSRKAGRT